MATNQPNQFTQFVLTDEEQLSGTIYNHNQLMVLQNLRAEYALRKVQLKFDPNNQQQFLQEEAEIHGWINCINSLLAQHDESAQIAPETNQEKQPQSGSEYQVFRE